MKDTVENAFELDILHMQGKGFLTPGCECSVADRVGPQRPTVRQHWIHFNEKWAPAKFNAAPCPRVNE